VRVGGHVVVVLAIAGAADALQDALRDQAARVRADAGAAHAQPLGDRVQGQRLGRDQEQAEDAAGDARQPVALAETAGALDEGG
jgi:hypothetical protein